MPFKNKKSRTTYQMPSEFQKRQQVVFSRVSWSPSFANAVKRRMNIEAAIRAGEYHAAAFSLLGTGKGVLLPKTVTQRSRLEREVKAGITYHAPWLNGDAIAHRRSVGAQTVNGFYYN